MLLGKLFKKKKIIEEVVPPLKGKLSIDMAKELNSSSLWAAACGELDLWIRSADLRLRHCASVETKLLQKEIEILERVKRLPRVVIDRES